jgi:hypothetical protein
MGWVTELITTIIYWVGTWAGQFEDARITTLQKLEAIWTIITTKFGEVKTFLDEQIAKFKTLGANIIQGLVDGFNSVWSKLVEKFEFLKKLKDLWDGVKGSITGKGDPNDPKSASGGWQLAGHRTVINEVGQEVFIPSQNGLIIPHGALWNLLGEGSGSSQNIINNVNVEVNNPVVRDGADIKKLADEVGRRLADQLTRKVNYGGNFG